MGNSKSIESLNVAMPSHPGEWTILTRLSYCTVLKNNDTNFVAEEYLVAKNPKMSALKAFEIYEYRRTQTQNLVEVYQAQQESSSYLCHGRQYLKVKTQRIPHRLSESSLLSLQQGLYVLINSLIGYKTIFEFHGRSIIDDQMIGFNSQGKVKVWLSSNFAKNTPDSNLNFKQQDLRLNEKSMVAQVLDIVKEHLSNQEYPEQFLRLYQQISPYTFHETIQFVIDYAKYAKLILPNSIIFRPEQQKIISLSVMQVQNNRGQSLLLKNAQILKSNQSKMPCGLFQTSVNYQFPPVSSPQKHPVSQLSSSQKTQTIVSLSQSSSSRHNHKGKMTQRVQQVVGSPPELDIQSNVTTQSNVTNQNQAFSFKRLNTNRDDIVQQNINSITFNNRIPIPTPITIQQTLPFQALPTQAFNHQRLASAERPTSVYNSRSLQKTHLIQQHNILPHKININNDYYSGQQNLHQRVLVQKVIPNINPQIRGSNAYYSPDHKIMSGVQTPRCKTPSVIDQLNPNSKTRIQNIISHNSRVQSPSRIIISNQLTPTLSRPQSGHKQFCFNQPQFTFMVPKPQSLIIEKVTQSANQIQEAFEPIRVPQLGYLVHGINSENNVEVASKQDYIKPEIRQLITRTSKQFQTRTNNLVSSFNKQNVPQVQHEIVNNTSTVQKQKSHLSQLKQIQVKNYLIGHSQVSPMKTFDERNNIFSVSNTKIQQPSLNNKSISRNSLSQNIQQQKQVVEENSFQTNLLNYNQREEIVTTPIQEQIDMFQQKQESKNSIEIDNHRTISNAEIVLIQKQQINYLQGSQPTFKVVQPAPSQNQLISVSSINNISGLEDLVYKNSKFVQQNILNDMDDFEKKLENQIKVPTYAELRQSLLAENRKHNVLEFESF